MVRCVLQHNVITSRKKRMLYKTITTHKRIWKRLRAAAGKGACRLCEPSPCISNIIDLSGGRTFCQSWLFVVAAVLVGWSDARDTILRVSWFHPFRLLFSLTRRTLGRMYEQRIRLSSLNIELKTVASWCCHYRQRLLLRLWTFLRTDAIPSKRITTAIDSDNLDSHNKTS